MSREGDAIDVGALIEAVSAAPHQYVDGNGGPVPMGPLRLPGSLIHWSFHKLAKLRRTHRPIPLYCQRPERCTGVPAREFPEPAARTREFLIAPDVGVGDAPA